MFNTGVPISLKRREAAIILFVCIVLEDVCLWACCADGQGYSQDMVALNTLFFPLQGVCPPRRVSAPDSRSTICPTCHIYIERMTKVSPVESLPTQFSGCSIALPLLQFLQIGGWV